MTSTLILTCRNGTTVDLPTVEPTDADLDAIEHGTWQQVQQRLAAAIAAAHAERRDAA